jgi:hypothetical protein
VLTVQTAATVFVVALVLMLITGGALVYAQHGSLELKTRRRRRRFDRAYRQYVNGARGNGSARRRVGSAGTALRRATRRVDADLEAIRAAGGIIYGRIASVGALTARLGARALTTRDEGTTEAVRTLEERLGPYLDPSHRAKPEHPNANPDQPAARSRSLTDDQLEMLKAKLGKPADPVDDRRMHDVETLKAKLGGESPTGQAEVTPPDPLKRKLAKRRAFPKAVPSDAVHEAVPKAKLEVADEPAKDVTASSINAEARAAGLQTPEPGRDAGYASVGPEPAPRESPRRAASRARRAPKTSAGMERGAAAPIKLRPQPRRAERPAAREQPSPEPPLATECRIVWWRGYFKSRFYAAAETPAGERVLAESPHFRWRKAVPPPPEHDQAVQAHRSLLEVLERDGWTVARPGSEWFALELERRRPRRPPKAPGGERQ